MSWVGEPNLVGSGRQQITVSNPVEQIQIKLDFDSQGIATSSFDLQTEGAATRIIWSFDSDLTEGLGLLDAFLARYFGLFFDRWVGGDYEQGLVNLKNFAESLPVSEFSQLEITRVDAIAQDILFISTVSSQEPADMAEAMTAAYTRISRFINENGIRINGYPMSITRGREGGAYEFDAAIPVASIPIDLPDSISSGRSPSGPAVRATHLGVHDRMMPTHEKLAAYMTAHSLGQARVSWEHYISDPAETASEDIVTHVYYLIVD
jgi:effector-binding domain-containing protein